MGTRTGNPTWEDSPSTNTLITAARLNAIEEALDASGTSSLEIGTTGTDAAPGNHLHDSRYIRTVNGTGPDGTGNVAVAGGGVGGGGLPVLKPAVGEFFASPAVFGGYTDKPKGWLAPIFHPGYDGTVTVGEMNIWVQTAGAAGDTATVVVKAAGADGRPTSTVLSSTTHSVAATDRVGVATSFVIPATGCWCYVNLSAGGKIRCANSSLIGRPGATSGGAASLLPFNDDPDNTSGINPVHVFMKRSA